MSKVWIVVDTFPGADYIVGVFASADAAAEAAQDFEANEITQTEGITRVEEHDVRGTD